MDGRVRGGRGMASREVSVILGLAAGLVGLVHWGWVWRWVTLTRIFFWGGGRRSGG